LTLLEVDKKCIVGIQKEFLDLSNPYLHQKLSLSKDGWQKWDKNEYKK
jgi:hypothetical protein